VKITRRHLKRILQAQLNEISAYDMAAADAITGDLQLVSDVIMLGLEAYTSGKLSQADEYEYAQDLWAVLERRPETIVKSLIGIVRELEHGGTEEPVGTAARNRFGQIIAGDTDLILTLGAWGDPVIIQAGDPLEAELVISNYAGRNDLMTAVNDAFGPLPPSTVVTDDGVGVGNLPLEAVYDAVMETA